MSLPLVSAYGIVPGTYEVGSYHTGIAGGEPDGVIYAGRFTLAYEPGTLLSSLSGYTGNIGWLGWEETEETPPETPGPSGGGGHPSVTGPLCYYNWTCTNWFPYECPPSGIQERLCMNRGTCNGTEQMPVQRRTCEFRGPFEPLFDIFLEIPESSKSVCMGDEVEANIRLVNFGKLELIDAYLTYWVVDSNNKLVSETRDTRAVLNVTEYSIRVALPKSVQEGTYRLYAEITYGENKTAVAGSTFEVAEDEWCAFRKNILGPMTTLVWIVILSVVIVVALLIILVLKAVAHDRAKHEDAKKRKSEMQIKKIDELEKRLESMLKEISEKEEREFSKGTMEMKEELRKIKESLSQYAKKEELKKVVVKEKPPAGEKPKPVKISMLAKYVGETVPIECTLKRFKVVEDAGMHVSWYRVHDKSGKTLMTSYENIEFSKGLILVEVRKTETGYIYVLFKKKL